MKARIWLEDDQGRRVDVEVGGVLSQGVVSALAADIFASTSSTREVTEALLQGMVGAGDIQSFIVY